MKPEVFSLHSKKIYLVKFICLKYTDLSVVEGSIQAGMKSAVQGTQGTLALGIPAVQHQLLILLALCGQISQRFQALTGDKQLIATERSRERH